MKKPKNKPASLSLSLFEALAPKRTQPPNSQGPPLGTTTMTTTLFVLSFVFEEQTTSLSCLQKRTHARTHTHTHTHTHTMAFTVLSASPVRVVASVSY